MKENPIKDFRRAFKDLEKSKTYENAVSLQRAKRNHDDWRRQNLRLVTQ